MKHKAFEKTKANLKFL